MGEKSAAIMDELVKMRTSVATPTGGPTAATAAGAATGAGSPKYECELCLESFNLYDRKPFSLVPCGHSLCIKCFDSLTKTTCPYCRAVFTSKIPNWEIVKRLPKPILPIIFYQVEKKIVALEKVSDEYNKLIVEVNQEYRKRLSEIGDESNRKSNSDRIKRIEKRLDEINANNQELENNLRRKMDKIKSQIDTDEVKFNEENLKKTKSDMDKMSSSMTERIKMVKKDREELMNILTSNTNSTPTEILTRVENELRDNSAYKQVYRELNSIFAAANVVRPISNASDSPSMADSNVDTEEQLVCRPSQKIVIIVIIAILTFIFMLYPLAMIIIGSMNLSECPMNYLIPVWLVVGGSGGIVAEIFIAGLVIYTFFRAFHHRTLTEKLLQIFLFIIPFILVLVFNLAWFFTGNAWVYPSYKFVQFTESTNATTYCNQTVFLFAFWSLNFAYILFGIFLIALNMVCCCICFLKR